MLIIHSDEVIEPMLVRFASVSKGKGHPGAEGEGHTPVVSEEQQIRVLALSLLRSAAKSKGDADQNGCISKSGKPSAGEDVEYQEVSVHCRWQ